MSGVAKRDGVVPVSRKKPLPIEKLKKLPGYSGSEQVYSFNDSKKFLNQNRFTHIEGEALMQDSLKMSPEKLLSIALSFDLSSLNDQIEKETKAYQSWLYSHTTMCDDESLRRVECKRVPYRATFSEKRVLVNKVYVCSLLTKEQKAEYVKQKLLPETTNISIDDTWGSHSATEFIYLDRMQRSRLEREGSKKFKGLTLVRDSFPKEWEPSMSTQSPIEGYEGRYRPPSVVEMVRPFLHKVKPKFKNEVKFISKVDTPIISPTCSPVSAVDLPQYGTPVNEDYQDSVLISYSHDSTFIKLQVYESMMKRDARKHWDRMPVKRHEKYSDISNYGNIIRPMSKKIEAQGPTVDGEPFFYLKMWENCITESQRYYQRLKNPEALRLADYHDPRNRIHESPEGLARLDQAVQLTDIERWCYYWSVNSDDETRYQCWLAERDVQNNRPKVLRPPRLKQGMSLAERSAELKHFQWRCGQWRKNGVKSYRSFCDKVYLAKRKIRQQEIASKKQDQTGEIKPSPSTDFILVHSDDTINWTREDTIERLRDEIRTMSFSHVVSERIGLDCQIPMSNMEYNHITRIEDVSKKDSVDEYLADQGVIQRHCSETYYESLVAELARNSFKRVYDELNETPVGYLELGDSFNPENKTNSGIILPNSDSPFMSLVIEQITDR